MVQEEENHEPLTNLAKILWLSLVSLLLLQCLWYSSTNISINFQKIKKSKNTFQFNCAIKVLYIVFNIPGVILKFVVQFGFMFRTLILMKDRHNPRT